MCFSFFLHFLLASVCCISQQVAFYFDQCMKTFLLYRWTLAMFFFSSCNAYNVKQTGLYIIIFEWNPLSSFYLLFQYLSFHYIIISFYILFHPISGCSWRRKDCFEGSVLWVGWKSCWCLTEISNCYCQVILRSFHSNFCLCLEEIHWLNYFFVPYSSYFKF